MSGQKHPVATRRDHERFCTTEGWTQRKTATGKPGTHHVNNELELPDDRILYTRISHPVTKTDYGAAMWSHILREQLEVTSDEFWDCVSDGIAPSRGLPEPEPTAEPIPLSVVNVLIAELGLSEPEVRGMSRQEALDRVHAFWSRPR